MTATRHETTSDDTRRPENGETRAQDARKIGSRGTMACLLPAATVTLPPSRGVANPGLEEEDGSVIVDYKTDTIGEAGIEPFVAAYERQVKAYANHWVRLTGQAVTSCYLFFTARMTAVELPK